MLDFHYNPKELMTQVKKFTSLGATAGSTRYGMFKGEKVRVVSSGDKIYGIEAAVRKAHDIMVRIMNEDDDNLFVITAIVKGKHEWKIGQFKSISELKQMTMKIREFFIPCLEHSLIGILLNNKRMLFERNNVIRIGMRFWYGGAELLYKFLNGEMPDMIWVDGDITGLDKHIKDWQLWLYAMNAYPYYRWDKMTEKERKFVKKLMIYWVANISSKLVCHVGGFWRYMRGQMYSGGKETSHGDSWVMAFLFYCFCQYLKQRHPTRSRLIDEFMALMIIVIIVYGDDHIWCAPYMLSDIMNHETWRDFLKDYCGMELRDGHTYRNLLSVPDSTGRLSVPGPKFLKRHIIKNPYKHIKVNYLPYKEIDEQMIKAMIHVSQMPFEAILKIVGMAWDTQGTNIPAYNVCVDLYNTFSAYDSRTPLEIYLSDDVQLMNKRDLDRLIRKIGISAEEIFDHFPSLDELQARHNFDMAKANHILTPQQISEDADAYDVTWKFELDEDI